jgi:hypothetical protein
MVLIEEFVCGQAISNRMLLLFVRESLTFEQLICSLAPCSLFAGLSKGPQRMTKLTEVELHELIEALSRRQGGGNHGEMVQALRFLESQGWQFKAPQSSATE